MGGLCVWVCVYACVYECVCMCVCGGVGVGVDVCLGWVWGNVHSYVFGVDPASVVDIKLGVELASVGGGGDAEVVEDTGKVRVGDTLLGELDESELFLECKQILP